MIRYPYQHWMRYLLGTLAFSMALLLTPRALLDAGHQADSLEIPVNLLDNALQCPECITPTHLDEIPCDNSGVQLLHPDRINLRDLDQPCRDDLTLDDTSA